MLQLSYYTPRIVRVPVVPSKQIAMVACIFAALNLFIPFYSFGTRALDAFLPGVEGWEPIYNDPNVWHFRFNGKYPEKLVQGRERTYFEYFWNVLAADKTHSIPEADRNAYTAA